MPRNDLHTITELWEDRWQEVKRRMVYITAQQCCQTTHRHYL